MAEITAQAISSAKIFEQCGYSAVIIENFGDAPFYPEKAPPETIAAMALVGQAIRQAVPVPLGINVLRNDAFGALALAKILSADFIRVNILNGVSATDQGMISGPAHTLLRERERLFAGPTSKHPIQLLADVHVKHARPISELDLATAAKDLAARGGADAIIVSGTRTGSPVAIEDLKTVKHAVDCPVFIGSGLNFENATALLPYADGAIVATVTLKNGQLGQAVDRQRAEKLMTLARRMK